MPRTLDQRASVLLLVLLSDDPATDRYVAGIARTLDRNRYRLVIATVRAAGRVHQTVKALGIPAFSLGCGSSWSYPLAIWRLGRLIRREQIDIIHGNEELPAFLSGIAGFLSRRGIRIYHRQHDVSASYVKLLGPGHRMLMQGVRSRLASIRYGLVDRVAGGMAHSVLTLAENHREIVLRERPQWKAKTAVAFHGVDAPEDLSKAREEAEALRRRLGIAALDLVLTIVGRLNWRKGHAILFDALASLSTEGRRAPHLLVVGYGPLEDDLRERARGMGLDRVHFLGAHREVWPFYLAGDLTLVPSVTEPFGLVAIEALACGRPVIASRLGGLQEIIVDGEHGRLVPPSDPAALARAIGDFMDAPAQLERMGRLARQRYEQEFTQVAMAHRWERHYESLLRARRASLESTSSRGLTS